MIADLSSILGIIVSSAGIIQSAFYNKSSNKDNSQIKDELNRINSAIEQFAIEKKNILKELSKIESIILKEEGKLPKDVKLVEKWVSDLEIQSKNSNENGFLISTNQIGNISNKWEVKKKFLGNIIFPYTFNANKNLNYIVESKNPMFLAAIEMLKSNQTRIAIELLQQLINKELHSESERWVYLNNLSICYLKTNDLKKSLDCINTAFDIEQSDKTVLAFNKAVILYELNDFKNAHVFFRQALKNTNLVYEALNGMMDSASRSN